MSARAMPGVFAAGMATPLAFGANMASPQRRAMIERHLRRVDPSLGGLPAAPSGAAGLRLLRPVLAGELPAPDARRRAVDAGFGQDGLRAHRRRRSTRATASILALPHLGGWEWAGRWIADRGHPITVVVERIEPPELFEWFADLRSELGHDRRAARARRRHRP